MVPHQFLMLLEAEAEDTELQTPFLETESWRLL